MGLFGLLFIASIVVIAVLGWDEFVLIADSVIEKSFEVAHNILENIRK